MTRLSCGGDTIPKQTFFNLDEEKQTRILECAIDEFAFHSFDNAKLSNIIKNAQIPRGSFYQYFEDKTDLYLHIMDMAKDRKLDFMKDLLINAQNMSFMELFKELYIAGIKFAISSPRFVKITAHLLSTKGKIYEEVMKNNLQLAIDMYSSFIERDKEKGLIRKDIDTKTFAELVIDMTINVSVSELQETSKEFNYDNMLERITQIMKIIEFGVKTGE